MAAEEFAPERDPVTGRTAVRGGLATLAAQAVAKLLAFGFVLVVARTTSPGELGRYSIVSAAVLVASFVADLGTTPATTRLVSVRPSSSSTLLNGTLPLCFALGLLAAAGGAVYGVLAGYPRTTQIDLFVGLAAVPGQTLLGSFLGALDGGGALVRRAVLTAAQTGIIALGAVPVLLGAGIRSAIVFVAVAPWIVLVAAALSAVRLRLWSPAWAPSVGATRTVLALAVPFAASAGLTTISARFDVLALSILRPSAEVASYDLALRVTEAVGFIAVAVCGPALVLFSRRLAHQDLEGVRRAYAEGARFLYVLGGATSLGVAMFAGPITRVAFGGSYAASTRPLEILGAGQLLVFILQLQGALINSSARVWKGLAVTAANTAVTVVLDLILIPEYGAIGAAWAMVGTYVWSVTIVDVFNRRALGFKTPLPHPGVPAALIGAGLAVAATRGTSPFLALVVGTAVYSGLLVATRAITGADIERARHALRRLEDRSAPPPSETSERDDDPEADVREVELAGGEVEEPVERP